MAIEEGKAAPLFTLKDQQGNKVALKDFRGKDVIVYFYIMCTYLFLVILCRLHSVLTRFNSFYYHIPIQQLLCQLQYPTWRVSLCHMQPMDVQRGTPLPLS